MRLIDADELLENLEKERERGFPANENLSLYAISSVIHSHTVDPVAHGHWNIDKRQLYGINVYNCSVCKEPFLIQFGNPKDNKYNYCPNCGAKMDEQKDYCADCPDATYGRCEGCQHEH